MTMPNRIIHESARFSPTLAVISPPAERLFWRLITVTDDFGRFNAETAIVKAMCFPLFPKLTSDQIDAQLSELVSSGLIQTYRHGEHRLGYFLTWSKYQTCRAVKSKFPGPDDNGSERLQTFDGGRQRPPTLVSNTNRSRSRSRISLSNIDPVLGSGSGSQGDGQQAEPKLSQFDRFYRP
jgi:hypothetical protein